jgi:hypothetical protein
MRSHYISMLGCLSILIACRVAAAQDRDTKVRNDREQFQEDRNWIYNDLPKALAAAGELGKPVLVVVRCIP